MEEKVYLLFTKVRYYNTNFFGIKSVHYEWVQSRAIDYKTTYLMNYLSGESNY